MGVVLLNTAASNTDNNASSSINQLKVQEIVNEFALDAETRIDDNSVILLEDNSYIVSIFIAKNSSLYFKDYADNQEGNSFKIETFNTTKTLGRIAQVTAIDYQFEFIKIDLAPEILTADFDVDDLFTLDFDFASQDVTPLAKTYVSVSALFSDQANQVEGYFYGITNATGFDNITQGRATVSYKGTTNGDESDYNIEYVENASASASGSFVPLSGTEEENPVNGQIEMIGKGSNKGLKFDTQTLHSLAELGHLTLQEIYDGGTRFYIIPKGNTTGADSLAAGLKIFSTDYTSDQSNYHDLGIWVTQNEIIFNSKKNGTFPKNLPFVWKVNDNTKLMKLQPKINGLLMLGVPSENEKDWTVFQPFQLGRTTFLVGRDNAPTSEFINNAYYDGSWKRLDAGYSHRFSMSSDGSITFWSGGTGVADSSVSWSKVFIIKNNGTINMPSLPTSATGLSAGDVWNDGGTLKIVSLTDHLKLKRVKVNNLLI